MMKKLILGIALLVGLSTTTSVIAQKQGKELIDSLYTALRKISSDTIKVNTLNKIALYNSDFNVDTAIFYTTLALQLAERANVNNENIGWKKGVAYSYLQLGLYNGWNGDYNASMINYNKAINILDEIINVGELTIRNWAKRNKSRAINNIGEVFEEQHNYAKAIENYFIALTINQEIENNSGIAKQYNNIGNAYLYQGNYSKSQEYYFKALKLDEKLGNKKSYANDQFLIGNVFLYLHDNEKALEYYFKALKSNKEIDNDEGISMVLGNIGIIYFAKLDYSQALDYHFKALKLRQKLNDNTAIAETFGNIGNVYCKQAETNNELSKMLFNKANEFYFKALKLVEELNDKNGIARQLGNIGLVYNNQKKYNESEKYFLKALSIADSTDALENQKYLHNSLSTLYSETKQFEKSLFHFKKYTLIKDSLVNVDNTKRIAATEDNYRIEKKESEEREIAEHLKAETKRKVMLQYLGIFSIIIIVLSFVFLGSHIKLSVKTIDYLGFVGILLFFEFIEVLLEPTVSHYTHGLPALYMLVNIVIAATIKPAHHFVEKHMVRVSSSIKAKRHHRLNNSKTQHNNQQQ